VSWGDEAPLPVTELQHHKGSVHVIPKVPDTNPLILTAGNNFCAIKAYREYSACVSSHQIGDKVSRLAIPHLDTIVVAATDYKIGTQRNVAH